MNRAILVGLLLLVGTVIVRADDKPQPTRPPAPIQVTLRSLDGKMQIHREVPVTEYQQVLETREAIVNGQKRTFTVTVMVPITRIQIQITSGEGYEVQNGGGEKVDAGKLADLLKKGTKALMSADGKPIDPAYMKLNKEDTLVVVPIKKEAPK